jgi:hypothetical protein
MFVGPSNSPEICKELGNTVVDVASALSQISADEMTSPESSTLPAKRSGGCPSNEGMRKKARAKSGALATAVVAGSMSPSTEGICPKIIGKSSGTINATTPWVDLLEGVHEWDAKEFLKAKISTCLLVMCLVDNPVILNPDNFISVILKSKSSMFIIETR